MGVGASGAFGAMAPVPTITATVQKLPSCPLGTCKVFFEMQNEKIGLHTKACKNICQLRPYTHIIALVRKHKIKVHFQSSDTDIGAKPIKSAKIDQNLVHPLQSCNTLSDLSLK